MSYGANQLLGTGKIVIVIDSVVGGKLLLRH